MKKIITLLLVLLFAISLVSCGKKGKKNNNNDDPNQQQGGPNENNPGGNPGGSGGGPNENNPPAGEETDPSKIIAAIKNMTGITITLPNAASYVGKAETSISNIELYEVTLVDPKETKEAYIAKLEALLPGYDKSEDPDGGIGFVKTVGEYQVGVGIDVDKDGKYSVVAMKAQMGGGDDIKEGDLMASVAGFVKKMKELSGLTLSFGSKVTGFTLPGRDDKGAKCSYSAYVSINNPTKADFDDIVTALSPCMTGFKKENLEDKHYGETDINYIQKWTDPTGTKWFELQLTGDSGEYDYSMLSFAYTWIDKSNMPAWPTTEIDAYIGEKGALPVPEFIWNDVYVDADEDEFVIEIEMDDSDGFDEYMDSLLKNGFTKDEDNPSSGYIKNINNKKIELYGQFYYSGAYIRIYVEEVLTAFPMDKIKEVIGDDLGAYVKGIESANGRIFSFDKSLDDEEIYAGVFVDEGYDQDLVESYAALYKNDSNFTETLYENDYYGFSAKYKTAEINGAYLLVIIGAYIDEDYGYFKVEFDYKVPKQSLFNLPTNLKITVVNYPGTDSEYSKTITKIGNEYLTEQTTGSFVLYYYYTTTDGSNYICYLGMDTGSGSLYWDEYGEYDHDEFIEQLDGYAMYNSSDAKAALSQDTLPSKDTTICGVSGTAYGREERYFVVDPNTNLLLGTFNGETTSMTITVFDTTVTSFSIDVSDAGKK